MAHPVLDEIHRVYALSMVQPHAFRRWQRLLRDEVQPLLDERERLVEENAALRAEVARLSGTVPQPKKRGRPRKVQPEDVAVGA